MRSKVPIKGKPDFTFISDEKLKGFMDLAQQMIFAYKHCDEEKTRVMREVWKQMSDEYTDRMCVSICSEPKVEEQVIDKPVVHKIKMIKRIKR